MSVRKLVKSLVLVFLLWFIGHSIFIITGGLTDNRESADVAVILGNKVNENGTLSKRLEKSQQLICKIAADGGRVVIGNTNKRNVFIWRQEVLLPSKFANLRRNAVKNRAQLD